MGGGGGADTHTTQNCFDIRVLPKASAPSCEKCKINFTFTFLTAHSSHGPNFSHLLFVH